MTLQTVSGWRELLAFVRSWAAGARALAALDYSCQGVDLRGAHLDRCGCAVHSPLGEQGGDRAGEGFDSVGEVGFDCVVVVHAFQ